jgi:hypothetical protein
MMMTFHSCFRRQNWLNKDLGKRMNNLHIGATFPLGLYRLLKLLGTGTKMTT